MEVQCISKVQFAQHLELIGRVAGLVDLEGETSIPFGDERFSYEVDGLNGQGVTWRLYLAPRYVGGEKTAFERLLLSHFQRAVHESEPFVIADPGQQVRSGHARCAESRSEATVLFWTVRDSSDLCCSASRREGGGVIASRHGDHDVADLLPGLDVPVGLDDLVQGIAPVDDRLERPRPRSSPLIRSTSRGLCFGGIGNMTFLPPSSGVTSARNGFWESGPRSDER